MKTAEEFMNSLLTERLMETTFSVIPGFQSGLAEVWGRSYSDSMINPDRIDHYKSLIGEITIAASEVLNEGL